VHFVACTVGIYYDSRTCKYVYYDARTCEYIMLHGPVNILWCTDLWIYYDARTCEYITMHGPVNILRCTDLWTYYDARTCEYITMHGPVNILRCTDLWILNFLFSILQILYTSIKLVLIHIIMTCEVKEYLLSFGAESFVFQFVIQKI
jgi:hypothetical protein